MAKTTENLDFGCICLTCRPFSSYWVRAKPTHSYMTQIFQWTNAFPSFLFFLSLCSWRPETACSFQACNMLAKKSTKLSLATSIAARVWGLLAPRITTSGLAIIFILILTFIYLHIISAETPTKGLFWCYQCLHDIACCTINDKWKEASSYLQIIVTLVVIW